MLISHLLSTARPTVQLVYWILATTIRSTILLVYDGSFAGETAPEIVPQRLAHLPHCTPSANTDKLSPPARSTHPLSNDWTDDSIHGFYADAQYHRPLTIPGHQLMNQATESSNHDLGRGQGSGGQRGISGLVPTDPLVRKVEKIPCPLYPFDDGCIHMRGYHPWQTSQWPASQNGDYRDDLVHENLLEVDEQWRDDGDFSNALLTTTSTTLPQMMADLLAGQRVMGDLSSTSPSNLPHVVGNSKSVHGGATEECQCPTPVSQGLMPHYQASGENSFVANDLIHQSAITLPMQTTQSMAPGHPTNLVNPGIWFKVKYQPPLHNLGKTLISECIGRFNEKLDTINSLFPSVGGMKLVFEGLSACEYFTETSSIIRLTTLSGRLDDLASIGLKLSHLLESIGYCFMIIISPVGTEVQVSKTLFYDLFEWLWKQFFEPDDSLPVLGEVRRLITHRRRSAFGPLQQCLIHHLYKTEELRDKEADVVAMWILGFWIKNTSPSTWNDAFPTDQAFWDHVATEVRPYEAALQPSLLSNADQPLVSPENWLGYLGVPVNFNYMLYRAPPKQEYSEAPDLQNLFNNYIHILANRVKRTFLVKTDILWSRRTVHFCNVSAAALALEKPTPLRTHTIQLLKGWRLQSQGEIKRKLDNLLQNLTLNHAAFHELAKHRKWPVERYWQVEVIDWLSKQLLSPNPQESYPVFGTIKGPIRTNVELPFGLIQLYLIYYFTHDFKKSYKSRLKTQMTTLALLREWYKTEHPEFWKTCFGCDNSYWLFVQQTNCSTNRSIEGLLSSTPSPWKKVKYDRPGKPPFKDYQFGLK